MTSKVHKAYGTVRCLSSALPVVKSRQRRSFQCKKLAMLGTEPGSAGWEA